MTTAAVSPPCLTVGLFWHSINSDNLGIGALTVSNIALVREAARQAGCAVRFTIFGYLDKRTPYVGGDDIEFVALNGKRIALPWSDLQGKVAACDLMLDIGGGDSFASIYGGKRLTFLLLSKIRTLIAGVPLIMSPQTLGPFDNWLGRTAASLVLKGCHTVYTRDALSEAYFREAMGGKAEKIRLTTDVAFALPFDTPAANTSGKPKVGLNPSGLMFSGGYGKKNDYKLTLPFDQLMHRLIAHFRDKGCEVHLIGHVNSLTLPVDDDYHVCEQLKAEYPDCVLAPNFTSPSEAKTYIAGLDFFTGARMHACIAAASAGIAVVPLAYSRKFEGLFGTLGYKRTLDCRTSTLDDAFDQIVKAFDDRETLKAEAGELAAVSRERLKVYTDGIADTMRHVMATRKAG
ncbi:polysaccharide pyruvyl transferase family protein [Gimibacter soli]|uniref:Polysaccharide pyruvyl transferase family protein n=1 Tax=Gimibacter soli TaxID=3024400 RepID=A0AAF0BL87_9PROT|nr:polysaccharide pyruvyl transferase family protein [Gimibacter soli]WCL53175.1 polysaccharide pyruvyl transferase family protein [Gimibacter soli]